MGLEAGWNCHISLLGEKTHGGCTGVGDNAPEGECDAPDPPVCMIQTESVCMIDADEDNIDVAYVSPARIGAHELVGSVSANAPGRAARHLHRHSHSAPVSVTLLSHSTAAATPGRGRSEDVPSPTEGGTTAAAAGKRRSHDSFRRSCATGIDAEDGVNKEQSKYHLVYLNSFNLLHFSYI